MMSHSLDKLAIVIPLGYSPESLTTCLERFMRISATHSPMFSIVISGTGPQDAGIPPKDFERFASLDIQWNDQHSDCLFSSISGTLEHVAKPYTLVMDTRDVVLPSGLAGMVDYLDIAPSHPATAGLHIIRNGDGVHPPASQLNPAPFGNAPGTYGATDLWAHDTAPQTDRPSGRYRVALVPRNNIDDDPTTRAHTLGESFFPALHAIYRTEVLKKLVAQRLQNGIDDSILAELFMAWELSQEGPFTLHGNHATHVYDAERVSHLETHHAYYSRFFDPYLMDQFHRAVEEQARYKAPARPQPSKDTSLFARLRGYFMAEKPLSQTVQDTHQHHEDLIRQPMGRFVHNLTIGNILMADAIVDTDWNGLKNVLTDLGMANHTAEETLSEIKSLCAPDPERGAPVKTQ